MTNRLESARLRGPFLELLAVSGLAFAQPVFDLVGKNTDLFVGRRISGWHLVAFATAVVLGPPVLVIAVEALVGLRSARARTVVHGTALATGVGLVTVATLKQVTGLGPAPLLAAAVAVAGAFLILVYRFALARSWLRVLALAPIVFFVLFLAASPVTGVVFGSERGALDVAVARPHRIVWIVFDELPESSLLDGTGAVESGLFPNFATLASTSTWYRNSTTIAPFTLAAVPGMLTSSYPKDSHAAATTSNYPDNVFRVLGGTYDVNAVESLTALCPTSICTDARHVITHRDGAPGLVRDSLDLWWKFVGPRRPPQGLDIARGLFAIDPEPWQTGQTFVDSLAATDRPRLDFLHVFLPHWPWRYSGTSAQDTTDRANPPGLANDRWSTPWSAISGRQRHLLQLQATDTLLGQIIAKLRGVGAWDDSLVVVTADHGVGFAPGDPPRGFSDADVPDLVWTPLFMKLPGQRDGRVDDRPARTVDIWPTIAEVIGVELPGRPSGRSLLGAPRRDGPVRVMAWELDAVAPAAGRFHRVDGPAGFRAVLTRRVVDRPEDPLALHRLGPFGDLIGRDVTGLVDPGPSRHRASLVDPERFAAVEPESAQAPWLHVSGALTPGTPEIPLAVVVNGRVAGLGQSQGGSGGAAPWWATLDPTSFHPGANDVRVYVIEGSPAAPRLRLAS